MGRINWFDNWKYELAKKSFDELGIRDKAFVRAMMYQTADELIDSYHITKVAKNLPVEFSYKNMETISAEDCFKCFKWFMSGNNRDKIYYTYTSADTGKLEKEYMGLMCPMPLMIDIYQTEAMDDLRKYRYKLREVTFQVETYSIKITYPDGNTENIGRHSFERIYCVEDTDIPFVEEYNGYRKEKVFQYDDVIGYTSTVHNRTNEKYARVLTQHEECENYYNGHMEGEEGDYAVYRVNKFSGGDCADIDSMIIMDKETFERKFELAE